MKIEVWLDRHGKMPTKAHDSDAGFDLYSPVSFDLLPGGQTSVQTGVHMDIPDGYCGFIKSRSGMAFRDGIITDTGVIDAGYHGEIGILLFNRGTETKKILKGDRFAQIVILESPKIELIKTENFEGCSQRGKNGFGSSGK